MQVTMPSEATSRDGSRRSVNHEMAWRPFTMAAVDAALASTHVAAATDTVRHIGSTG
jgi:hypothetical protein